MRIRRAIDGEIGQVAAHSEDRFDYAAEDELVAQWRRVVDTMAPIEFTAAVPGFTLGHQGPGTSSPRRTHHV